MLLIASTFTQVRSLYIYIYICILTVKHYNVIICINVHPVCKTMFAFVESFLALLNVLTPARPWGTEIYPACFNNICNQNYWLQCWQKKGRALPASTTFAIKISGCKAGQKKGRALPASTTFAIKITDCKAGQKKRACSACFNNVCDQNYWLQSLPEHKFAFKTKDRKTGQNKRRA